MTDAYANDHTPWRDRESMEECVDRGLNISEIADELETSRRTIYTWLEKHGLKERATTKPDKPWRNKEKMRELYEEQQLTIPELADKLGYELQQLKNRYANGKYVVLEWKEAVLSKKSNINENWKSYLRNI